MIIWYHWYQTDIGQNFILVEGAGLHSKIKCEWRRKWEELLLGYIILLSCASKKCCLIKSPFFIGIGLLWSMAAKLHLNKKVAEMHQKETLPTSFKNKLLMQWLILTCSGYSRLFLRPHHSFLSRFTSSWNMAKIISVNVSLSFSLICKLSLLPKKTTHVIG